MKTVEVKLLNDNVAIIKCGDDLNYIHFSGLNSNYVIMLFIIAVYDKVVVKFGTNVNFWKEFIYFIKTQNKKINKKIYFEENVDININNDKVLLYSGGKDSLYSYYLLNYKNINLLKFYDVTNYTEPLYYPSNKIIKAYTNIRDILFKLKVNKIFYSINMLLPLISNYKINYIGLSEFEINNHKEIIGIDFYEFKYFLNSNNIVIESPVVNYKTSDIIKNLRKINKNYLSKCGNDKDFYCYYCNECLYLYIENANTDEHNFDRIKMDKIIKKFGGIETMLKNGDKVGKLLLKYYKAINK